MRPNEPVFRLFYKSFTSIQFFACICAAREPAVMLLDLWISTSNHHESHFTLKLNRNGQMMARVWFSNGEKMSRRTFNLLSVSDVSLSLVRCANNCAPASCVFGMQKCGSDYMASHPIRRRHNEKLTVDRCCYSVDATTVFFGCQFNSWLRAPRTRSIFAMPSCEAPTRHSYTVAGTADDKLLSFRLVWACKFERKD